MSEAPAPAIHLRGKVAIVTGASRGIGAAIAESFAAAGAAVALAARKPEGLEEVASRIRAAGGDAIAIPCHVGKPEDLERLVGETVARFGKVDVLVNNAATNPYFGPMMQLDWGAWDKTFEVNLKGYFGATREVVRHLSERRAPGSIVNVTSVVGLMGAPMQGIYAMTKAALVSMTKTLAIELGGSGIRVNAIAPGLVETRFAQTLLANDAIRDPIVARTALGRVGKPEDIAGAALYLASDAASFVTGHTLVVDGGWTVSA